VCDCSDQAAHYHNLGPKLGASLLTRHIGWKQKQKVKKKKNIYIYKLYLNT
jgi:adenylate cyclase class IV